MPIDTRFINSAKDRFNAIKRSGIQYAKQHPRASTSAAAAALLAPLLLQNENRDYTQTAAFTTPLIGAVAYSVSRLGPSMSQSAERIVSMPKAHREWRTGNHATEVTYSDIMDAQKAYENQTAALTMFQSKKRKFYAGRRRGGPDLIREGDKLTATVGRNLNTDSRIRYISNAIHSEKMRSLSASEIVDWSKSFSSGEEWAVGTIPKIAPVLTTKQIENEIRTQTKLGNSSFIRGMSSRMDRMNRFIDPGGSLTKDSSLNSRSRFTEDIPWMNAEGAQELIRKSRPDLYEAINKSITSGYIRERIFPSRIRIMESLGFH
jgi:hypothetical protein